MFYVIYFLDFHETLKSFSKIYYFLTFHLDFIYFLVIYNKIIFLVFLIFNRVIKQRCHFFHHHYKTNQYFILFSKRTPRLYNRNTFCCRIFISGFLLSSITNVKPNKSKPTLNLFSYTGMCILTLKITDVLF